MRPDIKQALLLRLDRLEMINRQLGDELRKFRETLKAEEAGRALEYPPKVRRSLNSRNPLQP